jgi:hypothetical protein
MACRQKDRRPAADRPFFAIVVVDGDLVMYFTKQLLAE